MIEKLDPNDAQDNRNIFILRKLNEVIDWVNEHDGQDDKKEDTEDDPADSFA